MKVLAVGDLHTKSWILYQVAEILDKYDHIVFVGDYADEWDKSPSNTLATWNLLKTFMEANPKVKAVIGNHDYAYIHDEIAGHSSGFDPITYHLINTPEKKELKEWLESLPITLDVDGVTYSHAGVTEQWDGKMNVYSVWSELSPIWARPKEFQGRAVYKNIPQVIGHNPSQTIWNPQPNVWCIDTFSLDQNKNPIGDKSVLEITDGKEFNIVKLDDLLDISVEKG